MTIACLVQLNLVFSTYSLLRAFPCFLLDVFLQDKFDDFDEWNSVLSNCYTPSFFIYLK
jgi:hypothetical protein